MVELGCLGGVVEIDKIHVNELKMRYPEYKFFIDNDLAFGDTAKIVGWLIEKWHKLVIVKHGKSKCNRISINNNLVSRIT